MCQDVDRISIFQDQITHSQTCLALLVTEILHQQTIWYEIYPNLKIMAKKITIIWKTLIVMNWLEEVFLKNLITQTPKRLENKFRPLMLSKRRNIPWIWRKWTSLEMQPVVKTHIVHDQTDNRYNQKQRLLITQWFLRKDLLFLKVLGIISNNSNNQMLHHHLKK